ncbi:family 2 glycosyl transferase, partial [Streptomyces sp. SID5910]|nr:family 2 glycosyl transferase [Streptomyces sp. SID5910]
SSSRTPGGWRATWAYALLLTVTTAFTPVVWPIALLLGVGVLVLRRGDITAYGLRLLAQLGTPLLVLAPWSLSLLPFGFFDEAGLAYGSSAASALDLLGASPGGPGTVGGLVLIGIVLAALAALLRSERQLAVRTAWAVALVALVLAVLSNRSAWAGPATLVYGIALLSAAALGADGARFRVAEQSFGWRQPVAALIALASAVGPLIAAAGWVIDGADGPLERRDPVQVPAFVAEDTVTRDQARTLVLDSDSAAHVSYMLVRGAGVRLGDGELAAGGGNGTLDKVVANLVAGSGADQAGQLGGFAVRYVLVHKGAPHDVVRVLDATPGLRRLSQQDGSGLWQVDRDVARATIVSGGGAAGAPQPVAAGPVEIHTKVPAGGEGRVLRLADTAADGWTAILDGKPLTRTTVDGWAQGFELPASGGTLDVTYDDPFTHTAWLWAQGLLAVVLVVLALPGRRRDIDDDLPEEPVVPAQAVAGEGRRARRLRAQAEAEAEAEAGTGTEAGTAEPVAPPAPPQEPPVTVPQQASGAWDPAGYPDTGYPDTAYGYGTYGGEQYQDAQQYDPAAYGQQQPYGTDAYQGAQDGQYDQAQQYDPYAYGDPNGAGAYDPAYDQAYGQGGYDTPYDPSQAQQPHGPGSERPDGSQQ